MIQSVITGTVTQSTGSWYKVLTFNGKEVNARLKGRFRLKGKSLTNPIAVGDNVELEPEGEENFVIRTIFKRRNYLIRKSTKLSSRFQMVASNIDLAIVFATLKQPRTSVGFIDRFLTTCESFGIEAAIIFNKIDLLNPELSEELNALITLYGNMGYKIFTTSLLAESLNPTLIDAFRHKTTLVFGHSGVGKSTLINLLIPNADQQVSSISDFHGKGKHTTTYARMLIASDETRVIDTPGVKEFGMENIEPWRIGHYFRDFKGFIQQCKFNNCLHREEPNCAVIEAVMEGNIAESRYKSYLSILDEVEQIDQFGA